MLLYNYSNRFIFLYLTVVCYANCVFFSGIIILYECYFLPRNLLKISDLHTNPRFFSGYPTPLVLQLLNTGFCFLIQLIDAQEWEVEHTSRHFRLKSRKIVSLK